MTTRSIKSAVYAAGVVFAHSEDVPGPNAVPRMKPRAKRRQRDAASAYEAKFIDAKPLQTPASSWWRTFDIGWLIGRATA